MKAMKRASTAESIDSDDDSTDEPVKQVKKRPRGAKEAITDPKHIRPMRGRMAQPVRGGPQASSGGEGDHATGNEPSSHGQRSTQWYHSVWDPELFEVNLSVSVGVCLFKEIFQVHAFRSERVPNVVRQLLR